MSRFMSISVGIALLQGWSERLARGRLPQPTHGVIVAL
jgi:hypothetical protein